MNRCRRFAFFVDRQVQGALLVRTFFYWLFCLLSVVLMIVCWNVYSGPPRRFVDLFLDLYRHYGPALAASLLLLPFVLADVVRTSNRFVGPVVRLKTALEELADGRPAQPLNFRDDDFWRDLATQFNRAAARVSRDATERTRPTEEMPQAAQELAG